MVTEGQQTWRALLLTLISVPQERKHIAKKMGVNQLTLVRWATSQSSPRKENLLPLVDSFPQHRNLLCELLKKEFPHFSTLEKPYQEHAGEIPSAFYSRVFAALATSTSILRTQSICTLVLQQLMMQLDPHRLGMVAIISQCSPPKPGQKIQSLREVRQRSTLGREAELENGFRLLGTESLAGYALSTGHPIIVGNREEKARMFPAHHRNWEESAFASPILLANSTAGCLYVSSTQQNYFSPTAKKLILEYIDLLALAFEKHEFYPLQEINLGQMPSEQLQREAIAYFQQYVTNYMLEKARNNEPIQRREAEEVMWQQVEDELLYMI